MADVPRTYLKRDQASLKLLIERSQLERINKYLANNPRHYTKTQWLRILIDEALNKAEENGTI